MHAIRFFLFRSCYIILCTFPGKPLMYVFFFNAVGCMVLSVEYDHTASIEVISCIVYMLNSPLTYLISMASNWNIFFFFQELNELELTSKSKIWEILTMIYFLENMCVICQWQSLVRNLQEMRRQARLIKFNLSILLFGFFNGTSQIPIQLI
jgi:hypothetical protein